MMFMWRQRDLGDQKRSLIFQILFSETLLIQ